MRKMKQVISAILALIMILAMIPDLSLLAHAEEMEVSAELPELQLTEINSEEAETTEKTPQPSEKFLSMVISEGTVASGICGNNMNWTLDDAGTLIISGTGAMSDYDNHSPKSPWYSHNNKITSVVISEGVTSIGEYALYECTKLETVELPDSLESIGFSAFEGCCSLEDIVLPDDLWSIGSYAFQDCDSLTSFTIPAGLYGLGNYIFGYDSNVENIYVDENNPYYCSQDGVLYNKEMTTLIMFPLGRTGEFTTPEGITEIASAAFEFCSGLEKVIISEGVVSIGECAFASCDNLKSISVPGSVSEWGYDVFAYSYNLTDIDLADGITAIGDSAFRECSALEKISIPETVTFLGLEAFSGCSSLKEIQLPDHLTNMLECVFRNSGLEHVVLPEEMQYIPTSTFEGCCALKTIEWPENLLGIDYSAFAGSGLTNITFPKHLQQISEYAFEYCEKLGEITFLGKPAYIGENAFTGVTATCFYYPEDGWTADDMQNYGGELTWLPYGGTCEGSHKEVIDAALAPTCTETGLTEGKHCSACGMILMKQEEIPAAGHMEAADEGVVPTCAEPGRTDGSHCTVCGEILVPQEIIPATGVHNFVNSVCEFCDAIGGSRDGNLTWVLKADGTLIISGTGDMKVYSYSKRAPWDSHRDKITALVLEEGVTSVSDYAFYMSSNLRTVDFPETLTQIGSCAFEECSSLEEILLPDSLTFMDYYAFEDCISLTSVRIPKGLEELNTYIFRGCENLTEIDVAEDNPWYASLDGVVYDKEIKTLIYCPNGKTDEITIPQTVEAIGTGAFYWCTGLTEITIPGHVKTIGDNAFDMCEALKTVIIEDGVESVGSCAFFDCYSLSTVSFPDSVTYLGDSMFHMSGVHTVRLPVGLKRITHSLFDGAPLGSIELPPALESIGGSAFFGCPLTSLTLPEGFTTIEDSAFAGSSIQTLNYPDSLTYFGTSVFSNSWVEGIFLPDWLTEIPDWTYNGCYNLKNIEIPDQITRIGDFAFAWCSELRNVTISAGVAEIGSHAFAYLYDYSYDETGNVFTFKGNAPVFDPEAFLDSTVTCYYPKDNTTWTEEVMQNYGGDITWKPYCGENHTEVINKALEATCTATGLTEGKHCSVCGEILIAQTVIPAKGHSFGRWVVTVEPNCTEEGSERRDCTNCDHFETRTIEAKGHTEVIDKAVEATCTETGLTEGKHCSVCDAVIVKQEIVPAKGHTEVIDKILDATCTETGLTEGKHCSACNTVLVKQEIVPAKGHSFGEWTLVCLPTLSTEGEEQRICASCGHIEKQKLEKVDSLDDIAWEGLTYRDIFINSNVVYVDGFNTRSYSPFLQNTGTNEITKDACYSGPYSLAAYGFPSQQLVSPKTLRESGEYFLASKAWCIRYTAGTLGVCLGSNSVGLTAVTDDFVTTAGIVSATTDNKAFLGSFHSADLDGYVDDPVAVPLSIFESIPTLEQLTTLYETYADLEKARVRDEIRFTEQEMLDAFVAYMNSKAVSIGMTASQFNDPVGIDNLSSARDLMRLLIYADSTGRLDNVWGQSTYTVTVSGENARTQEVVSTVIKPELTDYYTILGGKTGTLSAHNARNLAVILEIPDSSDKLAIIALYADGQDAEADNRYQAVRQIADVALTAYRNSSVDNTSVDVCCRSAIAYLIPADGRDGVILFEKEPDVKLVPASITKVLTAVCALDVLTKMDDTITYWTFDTQIGGFYGGDFAPGDALTLQDALYAMLLPSSNVTARAVARTAGEVILDQEIHVHSYQKTIVESTCTAEGYIQFQCKCGETIRHNVVPAKGHSEVIDKAVDATCTETGLTEGKHCSVCGETLVAQTVIPAKGHSFGNWIVTVEPTCTEEGTEHRDCTNCDHFETRAIEAKGHTEVIDKAVEATCTETGLTEGKHCSVCGETLVAQTVIPAKGHSFGNWVVTTEPTCTKEGAERRDCTNCDHFETRAIEAKGHTEVIDKAVEATCTENGLTEGKNCSVCGEVLIAQTVIPAKGHSFGNWVVTMEPNCTKEGSERRECTNCDHFETRTIEAKGHTKVIDKAMEAICTETGLTEGVHCSVCSEVLVEQKVIQALGHDFATGICSRCGTKSKCGDNLYWTLDKNGKLTISGTGAMYNYSLSDPAPWAAYRASIKELVIGNGVATIGSYAFYSCTGLPAVEIPDSVVSIGAYAFGNCSNLKDVEIPDSVQNIEGSAWSGSGMGSIIIGGGDPIESFKDYEGISEIWFRGNFPGIGSNAFLNLIATAFYPADNETWTEDKLQNYGGTITWNPYCQGGHTVVIDEEVSANCTETGLTEGKHCSVCGETLVA